jgi:uncharacterized protein (DUF924 family)
MAITPFDIVDFWRAAGRKAWFTRNDAFDASIRERFEPAHHMAARDEQNGWAATAEGSLALVLLLDQVPRNLWRGSAHAYATDPLARRAAARAINAKHDLSSPSDLRAFYYLPFTHSEDPADQEMSVRLTETLHRQGGEDARSARMHRDIIGRFGRFPHRNRCLGRTATPEETAFLATGGFSG